MGDAAAHRPLSAAATRLGARAALLAAFALASACAAPAEDADAAGAGGDLGPDAALVTDADAARAGADVDGADAATGDLGAGDGVDADGVASATDAGADADADATGASDAGDAGDASDASDEGDATDAGGDDIGPLAPSVLLATMSDDGTTLVALPSATTPADAAAVKLVYGPQGGYHVWGAFCLPAGTPEPVTFAMTLTVAANDAPVLPGPVKLKTKLDAAIGPDGWACRGALTVFVTCACTVADLPLRLAIETTDAAGAMTSASTLVVPWHGGGPCDKDASAVCAGQSKGG